MARSRACRPLRNLAYQGERRGAEQVGKLGVLPPLPCKRVLGDSGHLASSPLSCQGSQLTHAPAPPSRLSLVETPSNLIFVLLIIHSFYKPFFRLLGPVPQCCTSSRGKSDLVPALDMLNSGRGAERDTRNLMGLKDLRKMQDPGGCRQREMNSTPKYKNVPSLSEQSFIGLFAQSGPCGDGGDSHHFRKSWSWWRDGGRQAHIQL